MLGAQRLIQVGSSLSADGVHPELQLSLYQNAYRTARNDQGYDESLLMHLLGFGSSTFALPPECYGAWQKTFDWRKQYGIEYLHTGPLFIHELSHCWRALHFRPCDQPRRHNSRASWRLYERQLKVL